MAGGPGRSGRRPVPGSRPAPTSSPARFDLDDIPDLVPIAKWVIAGFAIVLAIGIAGAVSGAWTTLLLWINRVPFSPDGPVTDPVFGRDISFFLFDLPFFRFAQSLLNGLLLASLAGRRRPVSRRRRPQGGEVFITRVRVHLAVIAGLYLLSVAFGYQLDKYELVYSTPGVAVGVALHGRQRPVHGLRRAHLPVRPRRRAPRRRRLHALDVAARRRSSIIWFSASLVLGRLYPEAIQRLTVDPNEYAQEEQYIANNIAMTRLAFGLDQWETRDYAGRRRSPRRRSRNEADTFTNARLWDYRPLQATLDQLQTVRQYYDFVDVDTDRYMVDGDLRQVMLSGRELAIERNPQATSWVNQRSSTRTASALAMVPVNEVTQEGQPQLWIKDLPPALEQRRPRDHPAADLLRRGRRPLRRDPAPARPSSTIPGDTGRDRRPDRRAGRATPASRWTRRCPGCCSRLRFKDLDLLISDQITADSQLLFHRTHQRPAAADRPVPALRQGPVPGHRRPRGAWSTSRTPTRSATTSPTRRGSTRCELGAESRASAGDDLNYIRNSVKIMMDAYDGTMTFYVADADRPARSAPGRASSRSCSGPSRTCPRTSRTHLRVPEELFNVQTRMYGQYHVTQPLTCFNNTDRWTVPEAQTNEQSLPSEAYYVVMRMPGEPKAEYLLLQPMIAAEPAEHDRVGGRPQRRPPTTGRSVPTASRPTRRSSGLPRSRRGSTRTRSISAQITLWNQAGSLGHPGQPHRGPGGRVAALPAAGLPPVHLRGVPGVPEDRRGQPVDDRLGRLARRGADRAARDAGRRHARRRLRRPARPRRRVRPPARARPRRRARRRSCPPTSTGLVDYANTHFELAQAALRDGDFATYGAEMDKVQVALAAPRAS